MFEKIGDFMSDFEFGYKIHEIKDELFCKKCKGKKFTKIDDTKTYYRISCSCEKEEKNKQRKMQERQNFISKLERLETNNLVDKTYKKYKFDDDINQNNNILKFCKDYVNEYEFNRKNNNGLLLYGDVGTGKTFYASCIINAFQKQNILATATNTIKLLSIAGLFKNDLQKNIQDLCNFTEVLLIDDLGAERDTSYSKEIVLNLINSRYESGRLTIITTNLNKNQLFNAKDIIDKRISQRAVELCPINFEIVSKSMRLKLSEQKKDRAREYYKKIQNEKSK